MDIKYIPPLVLDLYMYSGFEKEGSIKEDFELELKFPALGKVFGEICHLNECNNKLPASHKTPLL